RKACLSVDLRSTFFFGKMRAGRKIWRRTMGWRDAVLSSLRSFRQRHGTRMITRQEFITEELPRIISATGSTGRTPQQTLSRILQELRDEGLVEFLGDGSYFLQDATIDIDEEDLTDEAIDHAIRARR